jgi:hypothetical protein
VERREYLEQDTVAAGPGLVGPLAGHFGSWGVMRSKSTSRTARTVVCVSPQPTTTSRPKERRDGVTYRQGRVKDECGIESRLGRQKRL